MNRRQAAQAVVSVWGVVAAAGLHSVMSPPPSPWWVNACVLSAVAVCGWVGTGGALHNREIRRAERAEKEAAERRASAIEYAADCIITGRPDAPDGSRPHPSECPSVNPAAVARYAATMGVVGVTLDEAAGALRARLVVRRYGEQDRHR